jgi:Resolvase, N terminal domain
MTGTSKIRRAHLERMAFVYVRQSGLAQVRHHRESTARQYGLASEARRLGWQESRIAVIDDDLGISGRTASARAGYRELVGRVCVGEVGAIFGLEVSRLARSSADLQRLLEFCSVSDTLIIDSDGTYDLANFNDRLLLGLNRPDSYSTSYSTFRLDVELRCAVPMPSRRQRYPTCLEVKRRPKAVRHPAALSRSAIWAYVCRFAS